MQLSRQELKLALSLQRRLKFLRWWDKIGKVVCYPWTFYKDKQRIWIEHLQWLWDKKQLPDSSPEELYNSKHKDDIVDMYCKTHCGNPLDLVKKYEEMAMRVQKDFMSRKGQKS